MWFENVADVWNFPTKNKLSWRETERAYSSTPMPKKDQKHGSDPDMKTLKHFVGSLSSQFSTPQLYQQIYTSWIFLKELVAKKQIMQ